MKKKVAVLVLLFIAASCNENITFTNYPLGADFLIESETGRARKFSDVSARVNLVFFGFTSCPDICPTGLTRMQNAFKQTSAADMPGLFFVTVDPERDTPEKIKSYLNTSFPKVQGIRPENNSFAMTLKKFGVGLSKTKKNNKIDIEHSSYIFLTDKTGNAKYLIKSDVKSEQIRQIVRAYQATMQD